MRPPLSTVLALVVLGAAAFGAHAFLLPSPSHPVQRRGSSSIITAGLQVTPLVLNVAAASDNDWPSDSSDMDDASETSEAAAASGPVVDVEARKATIQELEQELLLLLVGNNRGFNVQEKERERIDKAIELLVRVVVVTGVCTATNARLTTERHYTIQTPYRRRRTPTRAPPRPLRRGTAL